MPAVDAVLRVGIVGLGPRGQAYANAFSAEPGAVVAAGSNSDVDETGSWWGYATAAEIVASPRIDAIVLTDPDADRGALRAAEALRRGKHVVWPAAPGDAALLKELAASAERSGGLLTVPNELRYLPSLQQLRKTVVSGDAGPLLSAFMAWRTRRSPLGDPLRTLGLPLLDLLLWCVGGSFTRAQVTVGQLDDARSLAALILRHESGLIATIDIAAALPRDYEQADEVVVELLGESAALRAEPFNQAITVVRGGGKRQRIAWHRDAAYPIVDAFMSAHNGAAEYPGAIAGQIGALTLLEQLRVLAADNAAGTLRPA